MEANDPHPDIDDGKKQIDAVLLCGEGKSSHAVDGERFKALLPVASSPSFIHVVKALADAPSIGRIFIIGHKKSLDNALEAGFACPKPVVTIEQKENLLANIRAGFIASLDDYTQGSENKYAEIKNRMILLLPGDAPLVTATEIEELIGACDIDTLDYVLGLTPEEVLAPFAPTADREGIDLACFHVKEGLFRINNLHLARPFAFGTGLAIQKMYDARYQKNPYQVFMLLIYLLGQSSIRSKVWLIAIIHTASIAKRLGLLALSDKLRSLVPMHDIFDGIGTMLNLRAGCAITLTGGAALDIDNDHDYKVMKSRFVEWQKIIASRKTRQPDAKNKDVRESKEANV